MKSKSPQDEKPVNTKLKIKAISGTATLNEPLNHLSHKSINRFHTPIIDDAHTKKVYIANNIYLMSFLNIDFNFMFSASLHSFNDL